MPEQMSSPFVNRIMQTQMARQIGQRMSQYGPEGQQWAQRLEADPIGALAVMQQYGGPQQVEFGLANAGSQGSAATADTLLKLMGPQAYGQFSKGMRDQREAAPGLGEESARWYGNKSLADAAAFGEQRNFYETAIASARKAASSGNPEDMGAADFALVQAMGKLIDPNSVVRNEEGKFIQDAGDAQVGAFLHSIKRWFGEKGVMSRSARLALLDQIQAVYGQAEKSYSRRYQNMIGGLEGLTFKDPEYKKLTRTVLQGKDPAGLEPLDFKSLRAAYSAAAGKVEGEPSRKPAAGNAEGMSTLGTELESMKPGAVTTISGKKYIKLEDGTFDEVE